MPVNTFDSQAKPPRGQLLEDLHGDPANDYDQGFFYA